MALDGVNILWTARYDYDKGKRLLPHAHSFYQVIWIAEGKGLFQEDGRISEALPGTLFWIRPGVLHGLKASPRSPLKTLDLKFEIRDPELERLVAPVPSRLLSAGAELVRLLDRIRKEGAEQEAYYKEVAKLHLAELLYRLARTAAGSLPGDMPPPSPAAFGNTVDLECTNQSAKLAEAWVRNHAAGDWTVKEMAAGMNYSESYLRQLFRSYKGCTIPAYRMQVRISLAKDRLAYSDASLKEIAEACGFKTIQHFSRIFKRLEGITPGQWRSRERHGIRKSIVFEE
ncbi:MAG: AraC family transcriptional regulator [Paenibacillaceae bacterium]|jgi:AraC-like DNA-binding protein|nr:AraC family transcriptional regulator [Paenibacillaceae bacterium]